MQLSNSEEQLMQHLWKLEKAFMKDLLEAHPDPKTSHNNCCHIVKKND